MAGRGARAVLVAAAAVAMLASAAPSSPRTGDPVLDVLLINLDMEKKRAAEDAEEFDRGSERLARAEAELSAAVARLARLVREGSAERATIEGAGDAVEDARARVQVQQERRRVLVESLAEHGRRSASLREEIAKRREGVRAPADPVTGRWDVTINPGNRHGTLRLALDGTIVSGDYVLDGDFRGSVRGTLVGDRLTLDRIDSERGFDAKFYGRVTGGPTRRIAGTWEATAIAPATGPSAGTWSALPAHDDEGEPK